MAAIKYQFLTGKYKKRAQRLHLWLGQRGDSTAEDEKKSAQISALRTEAFLPRESEII